MNNDNSLRNSLIVSTCMHVALLLVLYFGLPSLFKPIVTAQKTIPLEIVTIADITNTRIKDTPEEPKPPQPEPKPTPPAPPQNRTPEPPAPPEKEQVKQPEPPKPEVQAEALLPKIKPTPPAPPKPAPPKPDLLASVLKNVAKLKPSTPKTDDKTKKDDTKPAEEPKSLAPSLSDRLSITEEDLVRRQIEQFWNVDPGARNAENLVIQVSIEVNPDRTVRTVAIVDQTRYATDSFFRAAADRALRAVTHFKTTPLELPEGKYEQWKNINFNFDPKDMM